MDYYGKRLATCSSDRTIKVFSVTGDQHAHLADLTGHDGPVWQVAWAHPKFGSLLASCSYDRRVIIWKEERENAWVQLQQFSEHESSVNSIAWAPYEYGAVLACASSDGSVSVLTHKPDGTWERVKIPGAHPVGCTAVSWAPANVPGAIAGTLGPNQGSNPRLASSGCDNTVKIWENVNGAWKLMTYPALSKHTDWVRDVAWAPNLGLPKSTIASGGQDGKVVIWTEQKAGEWVGAELNDFKVPVWRVSWSLTGNILAVSDANGNVTLWKEALDGQWAQVTTVQ
ncbi:Vesicle coat complex COPII subunit SEC13 [Klebsormidium nitens]|uniref:Vesicle coat complex COPII subunit SEC13 n=1 Tax=Klebsormidium nitens TaxID=105231 RepID=A0A1Y1I2V0_KLENI|nr:Vesicle coat complex COPII subunit SEC13 [Klebsormidium nitens]|eukprot:GAQ83077.1 Vesicle coat complex COPII subunit SEC13 [Klebsormidium nitens]